VRFRRFFGVVRRQRRRDVVVVNIQVFGVIPHADVKQEGDENADGGKDGLATGS
jgi:hypothetical protein